ncbi:hypothetical protein BC832DRAFT_446340 [Gaertneriomyces semiglobifer]|nr:hypothetical protein BC832DRAFT_446340 [Gaertneriomyces semiglobifer]
MPSKKHAKRKLDRKDTIADHSAVKTRAPLESLTLTNKFLTKVRNEDEPPAGESEDDLTALVPPTRKRKHVEEPLTVSDDDLENDASMDETPGLAERQSSNNVTLGSSNNKERICEEVPSKEPRKEAKKEITIDMSGLRKIMDEALYRIADELQSQRPNAQRVYDSLSLCKQAELRHEHFLEVIKPQNEAVMDGYRRAADQRVKAAEDLNAILRKNLADTREVVSKCHEEQARMRKELKAANEKALKLEQQLFKSQLHERENAVEDKETEEEKALREAQRKKEKDTIHHLKQQLEEAKGREAALQGHVEQLTEENHKLKEANKTAPEATKSKENDRYLTMVERMIRMFETLTGVTIESVEDGKRTVETDDGGTEEEDEIVYRCRQKGKKGEISYKLLTPGDATPAAEQEITYEPHSATIPDLPTWIRGAAGESGAITFERNMAQMFFWRIYDVLMK